MVHLQFKQCKSWISKTFHKDINGGLEMILEVRVWQTVAVKDVFQCQFRVDKHLMRLITMMGRVVHLWKLAGKHFHLETDRNGGLECCMTIVFKQYL